jgi:hypothetical protein
MLRDGIDYLTRFCIVKQTPELLIEKSEFLYQRFAHLRYYKSNQSIEFINIKTGFNYPQDTKFRISKYTGLMTRKSVGSRSKRYAGEFDKNGKLYYPLSTIIDE